MNYSNHRLAGCAIKFTPETEQEVLDFWKEEGVEVMSGIWANKCKSDNSLGIADDGGYGYMFYGNDATNRLFPSVAAAREYLATLDEFKWGEEVEVSDDGKEWEINFRYGSKVIPGTKAYEEGRRHHVYSINGHSRSTWKLCRRTNPRLAEIERQIKELEAERDKIKSKL